MTYRRRQCTTADLSVAEEERRVAASALGQRVVLDATTVVLAAMTEGLWDHLRSEFEALMLTDAAFADLVSTREFCFRGDGRTLSWDPKEGHPVLFTEAPEKVAERRRRAKEAEESARSDARHVAWPTRVAVQWTEDAGGRFWCWLSGLDYAKANQLPLVSDDAVLRHFARSEGVAAFGSAAFLEVLEEQGRLPSGSRQTAFDFWRTERCVDLPRGDEFIALIRREGFKATSSALVVSRPAFWHDARVAFADYQTICSGAAVEARDQLSLWLFAATTGACTGRDPASVPKIAAELLVRTVTLAGPGPDTFAGMVAASRSALASLDAELPLKDVLRTLLTDLAGLLPPDQGTSYLLGLSQDLDTEDREVVREIVFDPN